MARPLTLSLGEILWDILPGGKTLGGAPSNVAWHLAQLGADARIVSAVGDDAPGREILERVAGMGFDTATIAVLPGAKTSTVDAVVGADGSATYTIHENVAWDALPVTPAVLALAGKADAVNFGSLAQRTPAGREATLACLDALRPGTIKLFDINLRPPFIDAETLWLGLSRANVVKMNHDELPVLAKLFGWPGTDDTTLKNLLKSFPSVEHVVVTRAENGAFWQTRGTAHCCIAGKVARLVDTIGAGDSVTAACVMGLLRQWKPERILKSAMAIAAFVCGVRGGTPALPSELVIQFDARAE